jgi:four helix bundle protein
MASHEIPVLDHERLEVYRVAVELHAMATSLLPARGCGVLRDQLERASLGVVLNIAEGSGRVSAADKRRFFDIARGSATETAAALEVARMRQLASLGAIGEARRLVIRIVQMLSRLCLANR